MKQSLALCLDDVRRTQAGIEQEMKACLALTRATLSTLAALSSELQAAADQALEHEARRAAGRSVLEVIEEARRELARAAAPVADRTVQLLQQGLIEAAAALPSARKTSGG